MKAIGKKMIFGMMLLGFITMETVEAQRKPTTRNRPNIERGRSVKNVASATHYRKDHHRTRSVRHPHYRYPRYRRVIPRLPRNHVTIVFGGFPYYYHSGIFYTSCDEGYVTVLPPVGVRIGVLPTRYTRIVIGPRIYFYASGIYYVELEDCEDEDEKYEVVKPEIGFVVSEIHEDSEEVIVDDVKLYKYNDVLYQKFVDDMGEVKYKVVDVD